MHASASKGAPPASNPARPGGDGGAVPPTLPPEVVAAIAELERLEYPARASIQSAWDPASSAAADGPRALAGHHCGGEVGGGELSRESLHACCCSACRPTHEGLDNLDCGPGGSAWEGRGERAGEGAGGTSGDQCQDDAAAEDKKCDGGASKDGELPGLAERASGIAAPAIAPMA